jgi:hypothetical protein
MSLGSAQEFGVTTGRSVPEGPPICQSSSLGAPATTSAIQARDSWRTVSRVETCGAHHQPPSAHNPVVKAKQASRTIRVHIIRCEHGRQLDAPGRPRTEGSQQAQELLEVHALKHPCYPLQVPLRHCNQAGIASQRCTQDWHVLDCMTACTCQVRSSACLRPSPAASPNTTASSGCRILVRRTYTTHRYTGQCA